MSVVRPEFGPTLPELLGPRVRALPRPAQLALAAIAVLVVGALALVLGRRGNDARTPGDVRATIASNLAYLPPIEKVAPRGRETLRLETPRGAADPQSF